MNGVSQSSKYMEQLHKMSGNRK